MPATGARRGHLVYHWKHGWIPLDHMAALSKAKGSHKGAEKIMQKHGISGGHDSHRTHPVGATVAARQPGIERETHGKVVGHDAHGFLKVEHTDRKGNTLVGTFNPEHARVVGSAKPHPAPHTLKVGDHATVQGVDEHGAPIHFTGEVRGTTAVTATLHGKKTPMLGITVKRESPTTGAMRHDTVYVPDPNRDPAKIDAARKAGAERDQLRRDLNAKYAGKGASYTQQRHGIDPAAMNTTDLAKYHKSLQAEHDSVLLSDGKKLRDAMAAEHAKRGSEARVRNLPPEGKFGGVHSETHMGEKITVRKGREWGTLRTEINGQHVGTPYGTKNSDAVKELDSLKATVAHAKANPESYTNGAGEASYGMNLAARAPAPRVGIMSRPSALDSMPSVAPRNAQMRGEHVVTAKEAAANRAAMKDMSKRAEDTLKAAQKDPTGKELLAVAKQGQGTSARSAIVRAAEDVGQGNHESARKRLETALADTRAMGPAYPGDKTHTADTRALNNAIKVLGGSSKPKPSSASAGMDPHAIRATQLREAAAKKRAEAERIAGSVGAPDRAGAMLRAKDSARMNARMDSGLRRHVEAKRQASALGSKAHLADARSEALQQKQEAANLGMTASKLSPGDLIQHKGQAHMVTKVNRTTVSVPSVVGGSWEDKVPVAGIGKHVKVADMKESTLRTLMSRAKGNASLQAVYAAELKRRGLSV